MSKVAPVAGAERVRDKGGGEEAGQYRSQYSHSM